MRCSLYMTETGNIFLLKKWEWEKGRQYRGAHTEPDAGRPERSAPNENQSCGSFQTGTVSPAFCFDKVVIRHFDFCDYYIGNFLANKNLKSSLYLNSEDFFCQDMGLQNYRHPPRAQNHVVINAAVYYNGTNALAEDREVSR